MTPTERFLLTLGLTLGYLGGILTTVLLGWWT